MLETLREMLDRDPFQSFRIVMTSGQGFEIADPHLVALGESQITVYHPRSDRFAVLRLSQVATFEITQAA